MKKKFKRKLHNFILRCVTDVAFFTIPASVFTAEMWPNKTVTALILAGAWIITFYEVNNDIIFKEA